MSAQDSKTDWKRLRELAAGGDGSALQAFLASLDPAETIRAVFRLKTQEQEQLMRLLAPDHAAELLEELPDSQAMDLIDRLDADEAATIIEELSPNQGADLLRGLEDESAAAILDEMAPQLADEMRDLIAYPEDVAGGLMSTERFAYPKTMTAGALLQELARKHRAGEQVPPNIFVTDKGEHLLGSVDIADLILRDPTIQLESLARPLDPIPATTSLEDLELYFDQHEAFSAPVVADTQRLVGRLRRRAVFDALAERARRDQLKVQGIVGGEELRSMPIVTRSRRRLAWLSLNIGLNLIAASVIAVFQDTLSAVIALAVFLPIVSDMSGCSGNQAVAVSLRELTLGIVNPRDTARVWWQEARVGLLNGLALGAMLALVAWIWQGNAWLGAVVGAALCLNTIVAVSIGGTIPLLLKRLDVDPAIASGPVLTTITDMCGFLLVLGMATLSLPLLER
jgi:magnesium transporter